VSQNFDCVQAKTACALTVAVLRKQKVKLNASDMSIMQGVAKRIRFSSINRAIWGEGGQKSGVAELIQGMIDARRGMASPRCCDC
jgi:hypothetical protein